MGDRRTFLTNTASGIVTASILPQFALAQGADKPNSGIPKIVSKGDGTQVWAMGVLVTVMVTAADTGGAYSVFEDFIPPGAGPVPHTHTKEDETIFVLEGKLRAWLGGKQYDVKIGDFVHMPRGVQHYFKNVSDEPTRMLLTYTPGGFEQWFLDIGKAATPDSKVAPVITPDDITKAVAQAKKYGVQFTMP
ncbi:MAG: quercetin 2,3-dioxygenase [Pirellulales bacterium]|nr:quercetin 2,3-dioxygenase [Pirellulales bacterium]